MKRHGVAHVCNGLGHFPDSRIGASLKRARLVTDAAPLPTSPIRESGPH